MIIESDLERAEERAELSERWVSLPGRLLLPALRCPWMWWLLWCPRQPCSAVHPSGRGCGVCPPACVCFCVLQAVSELGGALVWFGSLHAVVVTGSPIFVNGSCAFPVFTNSQVRQLEEQLRTMDQTLKALMAAEEKVLVRVSLCR